MCLPCSTMSYHVLRCFTNVWGWWDLKLKVTFFYVAGRWSYQSLVSNSATKFLEKTPLANHLYHVKPANSSPLCAVWRCSTSFQLSFGMQPMFCNKTHSTQHSVFHVFVWAPWFSNLISIFRAINHIHVLWIMFLYTDFTYLKSIGVPRSTMNPSPGTPLSGPTRPSSRRRTARWKKTKPWMSLSNLVDAVVLLFFLCFFPWFFLCFSWVFLWV